MSENKIHGGTPGGHVWSRLAPNFLRNLPLEASNTHVRKPLIGACHSPVNERKQNYLWWCPWLPNRESYDAMIKSLLRDRIEEHLYQV